MQIQIIHRYLLEYYKLVVTFADYGFLHQWHTVAILDIFFQWGQITVNKGNSLIPEELSGRSPPNTQYFGMCPDFNIPQCPNKYYRENVERTDVGCKHKMKEM